MAREQILEKLQAHTATSGGAAATNEGEWINKRFIDVHRLNGLDSEMIPENLSALP